MSKNKVPPFLKLADSLKKDALRFGAVTSIFFFKECFVAQGFTDSSFQRWKPSSTPLAGKRTLYKSGKLMHSIRKLEATDQRLVVVADSEYAEMHNEGGYITVTPQMKKYFWAMYYREAGKGIRTSRGGGQYQSVKVGQKARFCKAMALKKVGSKIKIDQRQFMGESRELMKLLDSWFNRSVTANFNKIGSEFTFKQVE